MEEKIIFKGKTKSGKEIIFRYPTISDVEILKNFINKISLEKTFISFQGEQMTLDEERKWLELKLKKIEENKCVFILGFIDGKLVGDTEIESGIFFAKHVGNFGITIDINYRGDGIGEIIMDLAIKEAINKITDLKIIKLGVFENNLIAQNLYKKMGFVKYGCLPGGVKHRDVFVDEIFMYKKVR